MRRYVPLLKFHSLTLRCLVSGLFWDLKKLIEGAYLDVYLKDPEQCDWKVLTWSFIWETQSLGKVTEKCSLERLFERPRSMWPKSDYLDVHLKDPVPGQGDWKVLTRAFIWKTHSNVTERCLLVRWFERPRAMWLKGAYLDVHLKDPKQCDWKVLTWTLIWKTQRNVTEKYLLGRWFERPRAMWRRVVLLVQRTTGFQLRVKIRERMFMIVS